MSLSRDIILTGSKVYQSVIVKVQSTREGVHWGRGSQFTLKNSFFLHLWVFTFHIEKYHSLFNLLYCVVWWCTFFWHKSSKISKFVVICLQFHEKNYISITVHKEGTVLITLHAVGSNHESQRKKA